MALTEILVGLAAAAATYVTITGITYLADWIKERLFTKPPILQGNELSDSDVELAAQTADEIKKIIGDDPVNAMASMTSSEKIAVVEEITKQLIQIYELTDIHYEMVTISNRDVWGYYCEDKKTLYINISNLLIDKNEISENVEEFNKLVVRETLDTVVHELRHAIQFKAAFNLDEEYLNTSRETRIEWAKSIADYIYPNEDPKGYANQLIERDAVAFAYEAMKGVFGDE